MSVSSDKGAELNLKAKRLPKRLLYVLRYGAVKEGLNVDSNGYVDVNELPTLNLLKCYTVEEILSDIKSSMSWRNVQRYEWKVKDNTTYVRAAYLRRFDPNPYHQGTKVKTLLESSMKCILDNLDMYDLEDFPDEELIKRMIHRLKRQKTVSNLALSVLFVPTLTRLDLEGIYLTNKTLRMLWTQCPHLRGISFKNCGYIITDTNLSQLVKNLPELEQLNLTRCDHLTERCLPVLAKKLQHLKVLRLSGVPAMKPQSIITFMESTNELKLLDVFYMKSTFKEYRALVKCAKSQGIELMLRHPKEKALTDFRVASEESIEDDDYKSNDGSYEDDDNDDDIGDSNEEDADYHWQSDWESD